MHRETESNTPGRVKMGVALVFASLVLFAVGALYLRVHVNYAVAVATLVLGAVLLVVGLMFARLPKS
jgi:hypothetical protein